MNSELLIYIKHKIKIIKLNKYVSILTIGEHVAECLERMFRCASSLGSIPRVASEICSGG